MPTGHVKTFDDERSFGFIVNDENGKDVYVNKDDLKGADTLRAGDVVEFDVEQLDRGRKAVSVSVTREAPRDNPNGRVMHAPPSWDHLEERDREARQARRRRR